MVVPLLKQRLSAYGERNASAPILEGLKTILKLQRAIEGFSEGQGCMFGILEKNPVPFADASQTGGNVHWQLCKDPTEYRFSSAMFYETGEDEYKILTHYMDYN